MTGMMGWKTVSRTLAGVAVVAAIGVAVTAYAQSKYPKDLVTLATHSSPGGGSDIFLREIAPYLTRVLGVADSVSPTARTTCFARNTPCP